MDRKEEHVGEGLMPDSPEADDRLTEAAHVLGDNPIFVVKRDTRQILACNEAVERVFGYTARELVGGDTRKLHVSDASYEGFGVTSESYIRSGASAYHCQYRMRRKDGSEFPSENLVQVIHDRERGNVAVVSFVRDLADAPSTDRSAPDKLSKQTPRPLAMDIPGAVFRRIRDPEGRDQYTYLAGRLLTENGIDPDGVFANPERMLSLIDPDDRRVYETAMAESAESLSGVDLLLRFHPPNGSRLWLRLISRPSRLEDGSIVWDGIALDVSREKQANDRAAWLASHDQLTGLMNRAEFITHLERDLEIAEQRDHRVALAQVGLRGMLKINETHGFSAGDELLRQLAQRLQAVLGPGAIAARSHGDIFLVKIDEATSDVELASSIRSIDSVCEQPFSLSPDASARMELCVGVARFPGDAASADSLMRAAALASERAHAHPEAVYESYDATLGEQIRTRFRMEASLRQAIDEARLEPYYQPQVSLADGRLIGLEALVRWPQADGDLVTPGAFIPLAEQTGLIAPMGRLMLQRVAEHVRGWSEAGHALVPVAVNCSAQQFRATGFVDDYRHDVLDRGIGPATVHLELTESTLLDEFERTEQTMTRLSALGVRFAIDDFGTGFSSLAYLARLPFNVLKIDRGFVSEILVDERQRSIVLGLIRMASALGLYVIAEGIETAEQAEELRRMGCDAGQGFHYAPALPLHEIEAWLGA